jgi:hypothetical protein
MIFDIQPRILVGVGLGFCAAAVDLFIVIIYGKLKVKLIAPSRDDQTSTDS